MNAVLSTVRGILRSDRELRRQVPYSISARTQIRRSNLEHWRTYQGPEEETIAELANNHEQWSYDPDLFWRPQATPDFDHLMPEAHIVGLFMFRDRSDK